MSVFVDTSAFLAIIDEEDDQYLPAAKIWKTLIENEEQFVSSSYVLIETIALIQNRLGIEASRQFHENVFPLIQVVWITEPEHRAGMLTVLTSNRRQLSLVDCTSFEVMRSHGIRRVFCFDSHFSEQGFEIQR